MFSPGMVRPSRESTPMQHHTTTRTTPAAVQDARLVQHKITNQNRATSGFEMFFAIGSQHLRCRHQSTSRKALVSPFFNYDHDCVSRPYTSGYFESVIAVWERKGEQWDAAIAVWERKGEQWDAKESQNRSELEANEKVLHRSPPFSKWRKIWI